MNSNSPLFAASPEDLALRIKNGDGEAALSMGLLCLSGLGNKQDIDQASSYFVKAKQLGAKNADVLIAYVYECNGRMTKAIDTYVGKEPVRKEDEPIASIINKRFKKVSTERKKLQKVVSEYGLPKCPTDTPLNVLLESLESGEKSLSDVCLTLSACDNSEHWCEDTAWLFYEEGEWELANIWMKKSHVDEKWLSLMQDKLRREIADNPEVVEIESSSLLGCNLAFDIPSENDAVRLESFKKELKEWGRACNLVREEQRRLEEEQRRKEEEQERLKKEAEERALQEKLKKEAEERAKKEKAISKNAKAPLKKEPKSTEKPKEAGQIDYHYFFEKGLFWFEESLTLRDEAILPYMDRISNDAMKGDAKAMTLLGYHQYLIQDYNSALSSYNAAMSLLQKKSSDSVAIAGLLFDIAQALSRQGKRMNAVDSFENCIKKLEESKEDTSEEKAMAYYHMSWARSWMGHTRIGSECLNNALSLLEGNRAKHALGIGIIYDQLAYWNSYPSCYSDALNYHLKALEAYELCSAGPVKFDKVLGCNNNIGRDYYLLKNYPKALEFFKLASNQLRVNQINEIVSYKEKDRKIKCSFDEVRINQKSISFFFSFDSVFNNTDKLVAIGSCWGKTICKRIRNNKVSFSFPESSIRPNKYFTVRIEIHRFFGKELEEKDDLNLFELKSVNFDFSRKRAFLFWGGVSSVTRLY